MGDRVKKALPLIYMKQDVEFVHRVHNPPKKKYRLHGQEIFLLFFFFLIVFFCSNLNNGGIEQGISKEKIEKLKKKVKRLKLNNQVLLSKVTIMFALLFKSN